MVPKVLEPLKFDCNLFIIYHFLKTVFKCNYMGTFDVSCGMLSYFISLVLRDSDTDSENVSLIQPSVSDGRKTCSSRVYH